MLASPRLRLASGNIRVLFFFEPGGSPMRHASWRFSIAVVCTLLMPIAVHPAAGQNPTFALEGVVTDAQQAVLPGVTVTIQNVATGLSRNVTTDEGGRFVVRG